jgi:hypothetical protein
MNTSRFGLALLVPFFALVQACSNGDQGPAPHAANADSAFEDHEDLTFADNAVNVDHGFSDAVDATDPNQLVIATAGNEKTIGRIEVGTILAGDRSTPDSKNTLGFLRKVTNVSTNGENTIIATQPAELDEWIKSGDLVYSDPNSIFTLNEGLKTKSLHIESGPSSGGGSGSATAKMDSEVSGDPQPGVSVSPVIRLQSSTLAVNAQYDGYFKVRTTFGIPRKVEFKSLLTLDPVIGTDLAIGVGASSTIAEKTIDLPGVVIPIAAPIPLTVRFHPRIKCSLTAAGSVTATVNATLRSHAEVGFQGDASFGGINTTDLSQAPTLDPTFRFKGGQIQANLTAQCALLAVPEVLAFDAVGLSGEVGPYVSLTANACINGSVSTGSVNSGFTLAEQHGLQLGFGARAQLPVVGIGKDFQLLSFQPIQSNPNYLVGDQKTCQIPDKDSCAARTDGFYCSVENTFGGIYCEGGQILEGLQCLPTQKCTGGTKDKINCK